MISGYRDFLSGVELWLRRMDRRNNLLALSSCLPFDHGHHLVLVLLLAF